MLMVDVTPEIAGGNWERGWDSAYVDASHVRGARNKCLLPIRKKVNQVHQTLQLPLVTVLRVFLHACLDQILLLLVWF